MNLFNYYRTRSRYDDWQNKQRLVIWTIKRAYYNTGLYTPFKFNEG